MKKGIDYDALVEEQIAAFWRIERLQDFTEEQRQLIREAYDLAFEAHKPQKRKDGCPYITHPISVAHIIAEEFQLGFNTIIAAFLHDVVEDTSHTLEEIREQFGDDVAFLVGTVTKEKKEQYEMSKQLDNYKQMLSSINYDIRALLVKLADRLHNMRTLSSMRPDKQMKIAGETDYFYAPLAYRLGLYGVKSELQNLSMQYRCPQEYASIENEMSHYKEENDESIAKWCRQIEEHIRNYGIEIDIDVKYCSVYTIWKLMQKSDSDFRHISHKYIVQITFPAGAGISEKDHALRIYSALTDMCKEMPGSIRNYIDSPKENGYQAFHLRVLAPNGTWQMIHIASQRMAHNSKMGCVSERVAGAKDWISKFKTVLQDMSFHTKEGGFMDNVMTNFYNDDIMVFTPKGNGLILPKNSTAIDFAYEIHSKIGERAQYARINGEIATMKTVLHRGDCVEIRTSDHIRPKREWLDYAMTYKAKRNITASVLAQEKNDQMSNKNYILCDHCSPLPGEEVIGFKLDNGEIEVHKRNCPDAIKLASQQGDNIINVELTESSRLYSVSVNITAIDRYHLLSDLVDVVTEDLKLSIDNLTTTTVDEIVNCTINFLTHSARELDRAIAHIKRIENVEEVKRVKSISTDIN